METERKGEVSREKINLAQEGERQNSENVVGKTRTDEKHV